MICLFSKFISSSVIRYIRSVLTTKSFYQIRNVERIVRLKKAVTASYKIDEKLSNICQGKRKPGS